MWLSHVKFKTPELEAEFERAADSVKIVLRAFVLRVWKYYQKDVTVTEIYRKGAVNDVHTVGRGIDVRVNGEYNPLTDMVQRGGWGPDTLTIEEARKVTAEVNRAITYDINRPEKNCVIFGVLDKTNQHWNHAHLQGHPNTLDDLPQPGLDLPDDKPPVETIDDKPVDVPDKIASGFGWHEKVWNASRHVVIGGLSAGIVVGLTQLGVGIPAAVAAASVFNAGRKTADDTLRKKGKDDITSLIFRLVIALFKRKLKGGK